MPAWLSALDGRKVYIASVVGIAYILTVHFIGLPGASDDPEWLSHIYQLILLMCGRSAVGKVGTGTETAKENVK